MPTFQQSRVALGSDILLTLVCDQPAPIFAALWKQIDTFEQRFSRFLGTSELSLFNAAAGARQPISPQMQAILSASLAASTSTRGIYNPFVLPALQRAGYTKSWTNPHLSSGTNTTGRIAQPDELELSETSARIPQNTAIDLGGIGKGYLLDELVQTLPAELEGFWLSLGGDIIVGGHTEAGTAWEIGIATAAGTGDAATVAIPKDSIRAIATSGITKRRGVTPSGTAWHHLIDPRTGTPANTTVLTATAVGTSGLWTDIYASCVVIEDSPSSNTKHIPSHLAHNGITDLIIQRLSESPQIIGQHTRPHTPQETS